MLRKGSEQPRAVTARDLKLKKQLLIYEVILLRKLSFVIRFLPFLWNKSPVSCTVLFTATQVALSFRKK